MSSMPQHRTPAAGCRPAACSPPSISVPPPAASSWDAISGRPVLRAERRWKPCTASPTGWWSSTAASAGTSTPCSPRCWPGLAAAARVAGERGETITQHRDRHLGGGLRPGERCRANSSRSRSATAMTAAAPPSRPSTKNWTRPGSTPPPGCSSCSSTRSTSWPPSRTWTGLQALLIPDLIAFLLTGVRRTEATNASTTGLFDAVAGEWATEFLAALGLPKNAVPAADPARRNRRHPAARHRRAHRTGPGNEGSGRRLARHRLRRRRRPRARQENFAYISSGTWSLVGLELKHPVLTEASREANFTNERGVDGTIRYLRNMGGLWLLSECQRTWAAAGIHAGHSTHC